MRGKTQAQPDFLTVVNLNASVPSDHPLRAIKRRVDAVLQKLSPLFDALYAGEGRPSIPPEQLLKSRILTAGPAMNISPPMALSLSLGPVSRVSCARMAGTKRRSIRLKMRIPVIRALVSTAKSVATILIRAPPTRRVCSTAKPRAKKPSYALVGIS
jgi:hypothetical protein